MRIKQLYSNFGIGFSSAIKKKYQFEDYTDSREPVFMFGCYGEKQIHMALSISKFSPLVVICWGGSDAKILKDLELSSVPGRNFWSGALRGTPNIKHIAISHWIEEDMQILKLPYYSIPITPHDNSDIKPEPLGDSIYMYRPEVETYNGGIYQKIKEALPEYNFIETNSHTYSREQVLEMYKKSFIGLRFTEHDGLSNTVCEMGLMGRRMIHNGDTPNCIPYEKNNINDIIESIKHEYWHAKNPMGDNLEANGVSVFMQKYLNINEDFLNSSYYD